MKRTDDHGNGTSVFTNQVIEENPYLQRPQDENEALDEESELGNSEIDDEDGAPIEIEDRSVRVKQRRRRFALLAIATLLLLAIIGAAALYQRTATRVDYGALKRTEVLPPAPNAGTVPGRDSRTEKAIEEAQRLTNGENKTTASNTTEVQPTDLASASKQRLDAPFKFPSESYDASNPAPLAESKTGGHGDERQSNPSSPTGTAPTRIQSQRSSETSLYMNEPATDRVGNSPVKKSLDKKPEYAPKNDTITLPAFASMLPVRTIGALYTLRTGALVRLELTRDISGDGWAMKRGTVLVGTTKGSDVDRAYVGLLGFVDRQTGKLVKLGGDLLGGDGATGLKGKRKHVDGGWTRVFGRIASSGLDIAGALLSARSNDTVIISDGMRARTINPVTEEISGVLGTELERKQGGSFVEVLAGTPGYVLVTDLPSTIKGTEAIPDINNDTLASLTDIDVTRPATGLSERELADLLANGTPEQIRAAMPRMSPEMRKIAEAVLRP